MKIIRSLAELRETLSVRDKVRSLVPTMGYLHEGHASLIRDARRESEQVCVNIFVNPLQFNNARDFETYPVSEDHDRAICEEAGADIVFVPTASEMLGAGPALQMAMPALTKNLCGPFRPGHFEGVLLIVAKLFHLFLPHKAYFGKKDYQQFRVIQRMVEDLSFPIDIIGCETIREADGLAMSSRNKNLKPEHREQAALMIRGFRIAEKAFNNGNANPADLTEIAQDVMLTGPDNRVEYTQVVDPETLEVLQEIEGDFVIAAAMHCGEVRLIDNLLIRGG